MPYTITTKRGPCDDAECNPNCRSRVVIHLTVATLGEARAAIAQDHADALSDSDLDWRVLRALSESGGTITLPDGTIIEVTKD